MTVGVLAFRSVSPYLWNNLPYTFQATDSFDTFKRRIKSFISRIFQLDFILPTVHSILYITVYNTTILIYANYVMCICVMRANDPA